MSVLRYPGGKTRAAAILEKYIPEDVDTLCSPFFGGGSFELFLKNKRNIKIIANDKYEPLINFWKVLQENKEILHQQVKEIKAVFNQDMFKVCKVKLHDISVDKVERAACFFAVNRSSFSGSTCSGGFSKESAEKRFNDSSIGKLLEIDLSDIEFYNEDFQTFVERHPNTFMYLDPPYYLESKSRLYGDQGNLHINFNHNKLAELLAPRQLWVMSYNDCTKVRELYKDCVVDEASWAYGMNKKKTSCEVVIYRE